MFGKMVSDMMIKPGAAPVFGSPADYGLEFEDVTFESRDGVTLRGWLISGGTDKVIMQSHFGVQCSRSGFTPKGKGLIKLWKSDIEFLRQAKHFHDLGYTYFMFDLRNHGQNDAGGCPWVSWGPFEALDVIAAVDYTTNNAEYRNADIGLLSVCMGCSSSTYAYGLGDQGLGQYANIKAMIAVQPLGYSEFVKAFGFPGFMARAGIEFPRNALVLT